MNVAGAWKLPVVFVVNNNQWAISVPRKEQTAAETLAQKAIAAGFEGCQVDGNDVVAVRKVVGDAIKKAKSGNGPTLVEALTYRLGDHTTVDDASRYRDDKVVSEQWKNEPLARTRIFLTNAHGWTKRDEESLVADCAAKIDAAANAYLEEPPEPPEAMFDYLYEDLPEALLPQREMLVKGE